MTEWNASAYERQSSLQEAMAGEELARLDLNGAERVLDVGCGNGKITAEIASRVPRGSVLGVDPSSDMIAFATQHHALPNGGNLRFVVGDVRALNLPPEFDLIVSFNALHWVPEQETALRSLRQALRPEGRTLLRFVPEGPRKCLEDVIEEVRLTPRWVGSFADFRKPYTHPVPQNYGRLAEECGLRVVRMHAEDKAWDFGSREAFHAFCRATFAEWTRRLPEDEWDEFIEMVLDRYRAVAATSLSDANTFKFYQLEVVLAVA
jgi:trans-aconitate 2-methyltransferase